MTPTAQKIDPVPDSIFASMSRAWLEWGLFGCISLVFIPTLLRLVDGPWRTEQEGHGPLIIAAAAWLAWGARRSAGTVVERSATDEPAYVAGWLVLLSGLVLLVIMRSQDVLMLEVAAQIPILGGAILLVSGWTGLRRYAFPLGFLVFAVPPPGWMLDIFTVPLKLMVSDWATELLYRFDFPIAQNGVMIMVGAYQLMVKDACSGMNSIFALSAIGFFYIHAFIQNAPVRSAAMLVSIVPITILANFIRVLTLILLAYYAGVDAVEGLFHDLTGFLLFGVALGLFFLLDFVLKALSALIFRSRGKAGDAAASAG